MAAKRRNSSKFYQLVNFGIFHKLLANENNVDNELLEKYMKKLNDSNEGFGPYADAVVDESTSDTVTLDMSMLPQSINSDDAVCTDLMHVLTQFYHDCFVKTEVLWAQFAVRIVDFCELIGFDSVMNLNVLKYFDSWCEELKAFQYKFRSVEELRRLYPDPTVFAYHVRLHKSALPSRCVLYVHDQAPPEFIQGSTTIKTQEWKREHTRNKAFNQVVDTRNTRIIRYVKKFENLFCAVVTFPETWRIVKSRKDFRQYHTPQPVTNKRRADDLKMIHHITGGAANDLDSLLEFIKVESLARSAPNSQPLPAYLARRAIRHTDVNESASITLFRLAVGNKELIRLHDNNSAASRIGGD